MNKSIEVSNRPRLVENKVYAVEDALADNLIGRGYAKLDKQKKTKKNLTKD